jgi:hypothetical protein
MPSDINITHIDEAKTDEKIGERKKLDLSHEKLFREYNIDPKKVFDGTALKQVPHEWIPEIIEANIKLAKTKVVEAQHIKGSKIFLLIFDSEEDSENFDREFISNMFKSINEFIQNKGENPTHYHRNVVFTKTIEDRKVTVQY